MFGEFLVDFFGGFQSLQKVPQLEAARKSVYFKVLLASRHDFFIFFQCFATVFEKITSAAKPLEGFPDFFLKCLFLNDLDRFDGFVFPKKSYVLLQKDMKSNRPACPKLQVSSDSACQRVGALLPQKFLPWSNDVFVGPQRLFEFFSVGE